MIDLVKLIKAFSFKENSDMCNHNVTFKDFELTPLQ